MLEQDSALAMNYGLGEPRGPGRIENPQGMVEGYALERKLGAFVGGENLVPQDGVLERAGVGPLVEVREEHGLLQARYLPLQPRYDVSSVKVLAPVAVAVAGDEYFGLDLGEPVHHAPGPEVGRGARPHGSQRRAREKRDNRLGHVRQVGDHPVAAPHAHTREAGGEGGDPRLELGPARLPERAQLGGVDQGRPVGARAGVTEYVLGVVDLGPREPLGTRHLPARENGLVGLRGLDVEELPQARPEAVDVRDGPLP